MPVKDREVTIDKANKISSDLIKIMSEEAMKFEDAGDPAEQIYLICHTTSSLVVKVCTALEEYSKIYGIEKLTRKVVKEWIETIINEYYGEKIK